MDTGLTGYFRCPSEYDCFALKGALPSANGFFRFGEDVVCYGGYHQHRPQVHHGALLPDAMSETEIEDGTVNLPFSPSQVISNLEGERYANEGQRGTASTIANIYYWLRPALPVAVRKHLQKLRLKGWDKIPFPRWPVDCSVNALYEELMLLALRASGVPAIPFIWFWPDGFSGCAVMTHDVETGKGMEFCSKLMDINDAFGIKASFQVVPEKRYVTPPEVFEEMRQRNFEICVHDLNHDGHLYKNREQFLQRVAKINAYGQEYGAEGFRAAVLYRNQAWFDALKFSYDLSVPNVAHLDPQRGGCCTVMPYFINGLLEIPVTVIQDYSLFFILHDYSIDLWRKQTSAILARHGMMCFIVHPDYITDEKEQRVYRELLAYLAQLRKEKGVWIAVPGQVNRWWRQRAAMQLVEDHRGWSIVGEGSERARVAYAIEKDGRLAFSVPEPGRQKRAVAVGAGRRELFS